MGVVALQKMAKTCTLKKRNSMLYDSMNLFKRLTTVFAAKRQTEIPKEKASLGVEVPLRLVERRPSGPRVLLSEIRLQLEALRIWPAARPTHWLCLGQETLLKGFTRLFA